MKYVICSPISGPEFCYQLNAIIQLIKAQTSPVNYTNIDMVGSSGGSICNFLLAVSGFDLEILELFTRRIGPEDLFVGRPSLFRTIMTSSACAATSNDITRHYMSKLSERKAIVNKLYIGVYSLKYEKLRTFSTNDSYLTDNDKDYVNPNSVELIIRLIQASASIPLILPKCPWKELTDNTYDFFLDGGISAPSPILSYIKYNKSFTSQDPLLIIYISPCPKSRNMETLVLGTITSMINGAAKNEILQLTLLFDSKWGKEGTWTHYDEPPQLLGLSEGLLLCQINELSKLNMFNFTSNDLHRAIFLTSISVTWSLYSEPNQLV